MKVKLWDLLKQIENQIRSVTEKPVRFLRLQDLTRNWSKHNEHSRNIFSVHGFHTIDRLYGDCKEEFPCTNCWPIFDQ